MHLRPENRFDGSSAALPSSVDCRAFPVFFFGRRNASPGMVVVVVVVEPLLFLKGLSPFALGSRFRLRDSFFFRCHVASSGTSSICGIA